MNIVSAATITATANREYILLLKSIFIYITNIYIETILSWSLSYRKRLTQDLVINASFVATVSLFLLAINLLSWLEINKHLT